MKIGLVSRFAPTDRKASSGTIFKMFEALAEQHAVTHIPYHRDAAARSYSAAVTRLARARGRRAAGDFTTFVARRLAATVNSAQVDEVDVLVVPFGAPCLSELSTRTPVVYLSDATFEALYGYYPSFSNFMRFNYRQGTRIERRALERADTVIVGSDWAKASVVRDYGQPSEKVHVIEYGANLSEDDPSMLRTRAETARGARPDRGQPLSMLFLGVDWDRKGGETAVDCCRALVASGIPARLDVVGTQLPDHHRTDPLIHDHGFLDKNKPAGLARFEELVAQADMLLLPTKAECSAIVYSEAAAYGLPSFTTDTGGVANYVVDGVNGYRLPPGSTGTDFAARISQAYSTGELSALQDGAFRCYADRLNWTHWSEKFTSCLQSVVHAP